MPNSNPEDDIPKPPVEEPPAQPDPEEPPHEAPAPASADQVAETNRILKDVAEHLKNTPGESAPSQEKIRDIIREKTGMSDAGIDWVMQFNRATVTAAVAPLSEKLAWGELRSSKASTAFPITAELEKGMKEELKQYPAQSQGDSVLLEKVYLMEIGKQQLKAPKAPSAPSSNQPNPIVRRTIVNNNPNPAGNGGGATPAKPAESQLSQEEKDTARKMHIPEAEYLKWKKTTVVTPVAS